MIKEKLEQVLWVIGEDIEDRKISEIEKCYDLINEAKEELRLPAQIGMPLFEMAGLVDKIDPSVYSTSTGLILYSLENQSTSSNKLDTSNILNKAKSFFKQFLP